MKYNNCESKDNINKVACMHYVGFLCEKCHNELKAKVEDVAWEYLRVRREGE
ncbi:hypothetical protein LCGC14_1789180 [marine sediment metagenome]|uniref:Uncharacterized protein n=1 Tax=marine sediment metagenome TaxID=412755 RepID=A0A0F9GT14_9ZZZZ